MAWTQARVDRLKQLFADGVSFGRIAADLGGGISRNAAIGKAHRIGLHRGRIPAATTPRPRNRRRNNFLGGQLGQKRRAALTLVPPTPPPAPEPPFTTEHMARFDRLSDNGCRYPLWSATTPFSDQFYCNTPSADPFNGRPYCGYHSRIAYTPDYVRQAPSAKPVVMEAAE